MRSLTAIIIVALPLSACGRSTAEGAIALKSAETGVVSAERVASGVRISNASGGAISYVVLNPMWLGLLASCADPEVICPQLGAGRVVTVDDASIHGFSPEAKQLTVRYWRAGAQNVSGDEIVISF